MPQIQTTTLTIQYTGVAISPDNFQINIIDYLGASRIYNNTDVTRVSRGTLLSGYNVSGITAGDVTIRATASGACTTFADVDISEQALQYFTPEPINESTTEGNPDSLALEGSGVEYILGDTFIYPFMNVNNFDLTHISTTGASGLPATGGPFVPPTLDAILDVNNTNTLLLVGYTRPSYSSDSSVNTSIYRVTYTPNGNYREFNYYWVVNV